MSACVFKNKTMCGRRCSSPYGQLRIKWSHYRATGIHIQKLHGMGRGEAFCMVKILDERRMCTTSVKLNVFNIYIEQNARSL